MNRLFSVLLIPLIVLGQAPAHSHEATGVADSDGHTLRPHVHLSVGHSHHHRSNHHHGDHQHNDDALDTAAKEQQPGTDDPVPYEHDADTIYVGLTTALVSRVSLTTTVELADGRWIDEFPVDRCTTSPTLLRSDPPDRYPGMPIYLLIASLRL